MRLIPAIDLKGGRCVRLLRGDFAAETRYDADPRLLLERYRRLGADLVHVVDLDGARDGVRAQRTLIDALAGGRAVGLQVGGGLRDAAAIAEVLNGGAVRAVVGSAALASPREACRWLQQFGPERIALAFDVRIDAAGIPCVTTHGWREQSRIPLWEAVADFAGSGLRHVLCTDVGRDGTLAGPHVALYAEAVRRFPDIEWQASGGIRDAADLAALAACGAAAAVSGKALLDELIPIEELRPFLPNA